MIKVAVKSVPFEIGYDGYEEEKASTTFQLGDEMQKQLKSSASLVLKSKGKHYTRSPNRIVVPGPLDTLIHLALQSLVFIDPRLHESTRYYLQINPTTLRTA